MQRKTLKVRKGGSTVVGEKPKEKPADTKTDDKKKVNKNAG